MNADTVLAAVFAAIAAAALTWLAFRRQAQVAEQLIQREKASVRGLEAQLHEQQRDAAAQLNRLELGCQERGKTIRASAFEEGRQLGRAESQRDHITELTAQQTTFAQRLAAERDEAARETREKTRAEFELQAKLYDVSVRPFLKIDKVKSFIREEVEVEAGYQYQLLVNGIPAFQPSIIIEERRRSSKLNEENINALLQVAERLAKTAAELYLGTGASVAKLGPAIIRRLAK